MKCHSIKAKVYFVVVFILGVGVGVSGSFYTMAKLDPAQTHSMQHAYRYGCTEAGKTSLNECDKYAKEYRGGLAMFLNRMGFDPND